LDFFLPFLDKRKSEWQLNQREREREKGELGEITKGNAEMELELGTSNFMYEFENRQKR
jgi:hypothetical protein